MTTRNLLCLLLFFVGISSSFRVLNREEKYFELVRRSSKLQSDLLRLDEENRILRGHVRDLSSRLSEEILGTSAAPPTSSDLRTEFIPVPRRANLSYSDFISEFARPGRPVILTNVSVTNSPFTLEFIERTCGDALIVPLVLKPGLRVWGGLAHSDPKNLRTFIREFRVNVTSWASLELRGEYGIFKDPRFPTDPFGTPFEYVFDISIPSYCPSLLQHITIPKYFAADFYQRLSSRAAVASITDGHPSIFIGHKYSRSNLHIDTLGTNFFMSLMQGKKHWRFFNKADRFLLYENRLTRSFEVDAFHPDPHRFPLVSRVKRGYECVLEAGETLFVPAGSPHQVQNTEPSIGVSMNYVDATNLEYALEEMSNHPGMEKLYIKLKDENYERRLTPDQKDLLWKDFKTWPRPGEGPYTME